MKLVSKVNENFSCKIFTGKDAFPGLSAVIEKFRGEKIFILTDVNTREFCLPVLQEKVPVLKNASLLMIPAGEENKNIETVTWLWHEMMEKKTTRGSLMINLGGGVVTDLGGFAAATFKRGITFIHVPTTLMGMVDAAIGGKTGVNVGKVKNQAGTFSLPLAVCINDIFLKTLPEEEMLSGFGEIIKYSLIGEFPLGIQDLPTVNHKLPTANWIDKCVRIKNKLVNNDFRESGSREILNFGHTFGHAFESLAMEKDIRVTHGHAVALGMICESYLSVRLAGLDQKNCDEISGLITRLFDRLPVEEEDLPVFLRYLSGDKKRKGEQVMLSLISAPGQAVYGVACPDEEISKALGYYKTF